jgi:hypothetical protein
LGDVLSSGRQRKEQDWLRVRVIVSLCQDKELARELGEDTSLGQQRKKQGQVSARPDEELGADMSLRGRQRKKKQGEQTTQAIARQDEVLHEDASPCVAVEQGQ